MLVKNPTSDEHGVIHYHDIGDYLDRDEKLHILTEAVDHDPEWMTLSQDRHGDWLDHRDDSYLDFIPMGVQDGTKKLSTGLFSIWSAGVKTNRDAWCYNSRRDVVETSMRRTVETYNSELARWKEAGSPKDVQAFLTKDETRIKWTREVRRDILHGRVAQFDPSHVRVAVYRPFFKQWQYMDPQFNNCVYLQPQLFPYRGAKNLEICISNGYALLAKNVPDIHFDGDPQCFPLYWYEKAKPSDVPIAYDTLFGDDQGSLVLDNDDEGEQYIRRDAITDSGLKVFQAAYPEIPNITKEDIFHYVYGILHSKEYRRRFENNLAKELPRIPLAANFLAFRDAGRKLAKLHLDYEKIKPWDVTETGDSTNPGRTVKMTYPRKVKDSETGKKVPDLTVLQVAENLIIEGIPPRAYDYVVNGKTAIGWLIDRYQVTTDKKSGIVTTRTNTRKTCATLSI